MNKVDMRNVGKPKVVFRDDNFLSKTECKFYQTFLRSPGWKISPTNLENINYWSYDLYQHYQWDNNWESARWLDNAPIEFEELYKKIAVHLPKHYIHWVDVKLTPATQYPHLPHRDKDPWHQGGDPDRFKQHLAVLCNLNTEWDSSWGGGFNLYETSVDHNGDEMFTLDQTIPLLPGQLIVVENCQHAVEYISNPGKNRISFVLHVLEYR